MATENTVMKIDNTIDRIIIPIIDITEDNPVFVVTAYRWGHRNNHSYVIGVYDDVEAALASAENEEIFRANKYVCEVVEMVMNKNIWDGGCKTIKRPIDVHDCGEV